MNIPRKKHYISRDPYLDWVLIITATFLLSIIFMFIDYSAYKQVNLTIDKASLETSINKLPFEESALAEAVQVLNKREQSRISIISGSVKGGDPSI